MLASRKITVWIRQDAVPDGRLKDAITPDKNKPDKHPGKFGFPATARLATSKKHIDELLTDAKPPTDGKGFGTKVYAYINRALDLEARAEFRATLKGPSKSRASDERRDKAARWMAFSTEGKALLPDYEACGNYDEAKTFLEETYESAKADIEAWYAETHKDELKRFINSDES